MTTRVCKLWDYVASIPIIQICLGIIVGGFLDGVNDIVLGAISFCISWLVRCWWKKKIWKWFGIGIVIVGIRLFLIDDSVPLDDVSRFNGSYVEILGVVTSDVKFNPEKTSVVLDVKELCLKKDNICVDESSVSGNVQTWIPNFPRVRTGEILNISGELEEPEDFEDSGKFSYEAYLANKGVHSLIYRPEVEYTGERRFFFAYRWLLDFRDLLLNKINRTLPEPHASLAAGILLGARRSMPEDFSVSLQRTGTTHVIAASGYNVTLVINFVISIAAFLSRKIRVIVAVIFVWIFVLMSGASLPVVRAGIMGSFALAALLTGNESIVHVSLPLSGAVMILVDPGVIFDISFQLSFLSTAGLIYVVPVLERVFPWIPESLKDSTLVTIAAIISTFPISAFNFGQFSLIAPVANFMVLPVVELIMILGMAVLLFPRGLGFLSGLVASICWVPLEYFVNVIEWLGSLSFASVDLPEFSSMALVLYYVILFGIVLLAYPEKREQIMLLNVDL
ncbi:ComEC/Rec2 family competence protein [Candidatus Dojkabacteria bacterium]|nr:ComEC/Rec2 family competence protein [Candidatus Dojkabacteria bacterium]